MTDEILYDDRAGLERAAEHYLDSCFRARTCVRASELAGQLDLTAPYLSRIAAELLREPISDYLRRKQLEYACRLLKVTPLTIEEIAVSAGFGTPRTMYRVFRESYGMTPDEYRKDMNCQ
jgi:AraC-like DNA-binding protein